LNIEKLRRHTKDPLYRNSLFLLAGTAMTTGLGFFFWMVVARYYTEYEVGVGSAIISSISLMALISSLGLDAALIRFLPTAKEPVRMLNSCLTLSGAVAIVVSGIFVAGLDVWSPRISFVQDNPWFIAVFMAFVVTWPLSGLVDAAFVAKRRAEFTIARNGIISLLKIPLPIVLALFFRAFGIVTSWGIAAAIGLSVSLLIFLRRIQKSYKPVPTVDGGVVRTIWRYSAGNYLASLFAAGPHFILPIMIVNQLSGEQNAFFYVAWTIAGLVFAIPAAAAQSLFAEGAHFEEDLMATARRASKFMLVLLIPAMAFVGLLGKYLLLLFGQSYSHHGYTLLVILTLSAPLVGINSLYYTILRVRGQIRELIALRALLALGLLVTSGILISDLLMRRTGIVGIGYAWIGWQAVVSVYVLFRLWARPRVSVNRSGSERDSEGTGRQ
jgi:O-antigen/teichoic acid export membrane protein